MVWASLPHSDSCIPNNSKVTTPGPRVILIKTGFALTHNSLLVTQSLTSLKSIVSSVSVLETIYIPVCVCIHIASVVFIFCVVFYTGSIISV